jgi:hypothetical protein
MKEFKVRKSSVYSLFLAFPLILLLSGCGREQAQSPFPPTVISVTPLNAAVNVPLNTVLTATFSSVMAPASINSSTFTVTSPGGIPVAGAVSLSGATATFTPSATLFADTVYVATISTGAKDPGGNALAANFVWSFRTTDPAVITIVPANNATAVAINSTIAATFNTPMNPATINALTFLVSGPGATPVTGAISYAGTTATFTPTVLLASNTLYTVTITTGAMDTMGNPLTANFTSVFTTDVAPTVVSTVPANGGTAIAINTLITATFSRAMDPTTITPATFVVTGPGVTPVTGTVSYSGTTATFTPAALLLANTLYTATITTGAKDPAGSALAANYVWTFTTDVAPTVLSTTPANTASAVALTSTINATFSRAMDPTTITTTSFLLTGPGITPVPGAVTYTGTTATFTPTAPLTINTVYTATITTGAKDTTGSALAANYVWTFSTFPQPQVTSTNPVNSETNVPINQRITATFNQPMNPATILAPGSFTLAVTAGGANVPGTVTYDAASNTAIFLPTANLAVSTPFTATITAAVQSAVGTPLTNNYSWNFTTGTVTDVTAPTIAATDPASAATVVPLNQKIAVTFSKAMDPATISLPGTFTVAATIGGAIVPGTVAYDTSSRTAVFTPTAVLAASTEYTATISVAARDLAGNALITGAVPNPWDFTTGTVANITAPTVTLTNPADGATGVGINQAISATFSAPMDPTTINNGTFTVAIQGVGGAPVDGTVAYDMVSQIATFTPLTNLAPSTQYTATISSAVEDLTGNPLAAGSIPNPWNFTTGLTVNTAPQGFNLGSAATFGAIGGGAGITNQGTLTVINGDLGTTGVSTSVTGFHDAGPGCTYTESPLNIGLVNGNIYTAAPPPTVGCPSEGTAATSATATQALSDANAAYIALSPAALPGGTDPGAGQLGGLTLFPGTYQSAGGSFLITGSDLTLDGQGDPNAVWVFQMASSLTVGGPGAPRNVTLINGAQAKNVYWQVGSFATINQAGGGTMVGTIIASSGVTFSTPGNVNVTTLNGRALGLNASVTMVDTEINVPAP